MIGNTDTQRGKHLKKTGCSAVMFESAVFPISFSPEMYVYIITSYLQTKLYAETRDQFHEQFGEQDTIHNSTFKRIIDRFLNKYQMDDMPHNS